MTGDYTTRLEGLISKGENSKTLVRVWLTASKEHCEESFLEGFRGFRDEEQWRNLQDHGGEGGLGWEFGHGSTTHRRRVLVEHADTNIDGSSAELMLECLVDSSSLTTRAKVSGRTILSQSDRCDPETLPDTNGM